MPDDIKEAKKLTRTELERVFNQFLHMPITEVAKIKDNQSSTALEAVTASILIHAAKKGDPIRINWMIDRLVGKVKESIDLGIQSQNLHLHASLQAIPTDQLVSLVRNALDGNINSGVIEGVISNENDARLAERVQQNLHPDRQLNHDHGSPK